MVSEVCSLAIKQHFRHVEYVNFWLIRGNVHDCLNNFLVVDLEHDQSPRLLAIGLRLSILEKH